MNPELGEVLEDDGKEETPETILGEVRKFLEGKTMGSVEFVAFSDAVDFYKGMAHCENARTGLLYVLTHEEEYRNDVASGFHFAMHEYRMAELKCALAERDIDRNRARIPGYYHAYEVVDALAERMRNAHERLEEDLEEEKQNYYGWVDSFRQIRDAVIISQAPTASSEPPSVS